MKIRTFLLVLISMLSLPSLEQEFRCVEIGQIKDVFWAQRAQWFYHGKTHLPYIQSKKVSMEYKRKKQQYRLCPLPEANMDPRLPLYAGKDKHSKDSESFVRAMFFETTGNYFIADIWIWSGDHNDYKDLLITYDLNGKVIDYITFNISASGSPQNVNLVEGILNKDLTVDIYSLDLNKYPVDKEGYAVTGVTGQRTDTSYQINPQGKFKLISSVKYKPQDYAPERLTGLRPISEGAEIPLNE